MAHMIDKDWQPPPWAVFSGIALVAGVAKYCWRWLKKPGSKFRLGELAASCVISVFFGSLMASLADKMMPNYVHEAAAFGGWVGVKMVAAIEVALARHLKARWGISLGSDTDHGDLK